MKYSLWVNTRLSSIDRCILETRLVSFASSQKNLIIFKECDPLSPWLQLPFSQQFPIEWFPSSRGQKSSMEKQRTLYCTYMGRSKQQPVFFFFFFQKSAQPWWEIIDEIGLFFFLHITVNSQVKPVSAGSDWGKDTIQCWILNIWWSFHTEVD